MAFPPHFLDTLRDRIGLADTIGRRVRLVRKGREYSGLCPFHNEKTPSFTVNEEKGFYHCFGCGAHGDVIGFVMQTENLSFPETVKRLADEAGLPMPDITPEERAREKVRATLHQVMEAAAAFFEKSLAGPGGRAARDYLAGRGLDEAAVARFRLGYAPDGRGALKAALMGESISEAQLIEAGLLIRPEGGGESYDRFRGRVTFPITDRRGRVIAFGARTLGDGQPKYLNSPDTPLFHKGSVLYGLANAWPAARETGRVVVAEGYMDVIALVRAGIGGAVAPLGTALTEDQIALLWRMAPEPVLCFDGDAAGQRAAARAAERALPLLKPGFSLRFVTLPPGDDPDTLIRAQGAGAMRDLLDAALPLDGLLWQIECGRTPIDTPERVAGLKKRLDAQAIRIGDDDVRYQYRNLFRQRLWETTRSAQKGGARPDGRGRPPAPAADHARGPESLQRRRAQILAATLVNHFSLLEEYAEAFGALEFSDPDLDKLRQEILLLLAASPDLDSEALQRHLKDAGHAKVLQAIFAPDVLVHAGFARTDADVNEAREGVLQLLDRLHETDWRTQLEEAERAYAEDPTQENWTRLQQSMLMVQTLRHGADNPISRPGVGAAGTLSSS